MFDFDLMYRSPVSNDIPGNIRSSAMFSSILPGIMISSCISDFLLSAPGGYFKSLSKVFVSLRRTESSETNNISLLVYTLVSICKTI